MKNYKYIKDDTKLIPNDNWQTKQRGSNSNEYEIYISFTDDNPVKSFEEWLNN